VAEKNKGLGIPETKGQFQFIGIVFGTEKDNFYKETMTKTQKPWRIINFGIKTDKEASAFINLSGGEKDKVFFSKQEKDGDKKNVFRNINLEISTYYWLLMHLRVVL
jgi:ABC-type sugar transport system ATPase subunit